MASLQLASGRGDHSVVANVAAVLSLPLFSLLLLLLLLLLLPPPSAFLVTGEESCATPHVNSVDPDGAMGRILDVPPSDIHARCPIIMGCPRDVNMVLGLYDSVASASEERASKRPKKLP